MLLNKKGYTDISDMIIFMLAFVVIGLVIGFSINIFYAHDIDLRKQEAGVLGDKIAEGLSENGLGDINNLNIYELVDLNPNVINNGYYYFKIEFFQEGNKVGKTVFDGNREFEVNCQLPGDKLPKCKTLKVRIDNYDVVIFTGSNYLGEGL